MSNQRAQGLIVLIAALLCITVIWISALPTDDVPRSDAVPSAMSVTALALESTSTPSLTPATTTATPIISPTTLPVGQLVFAAWHAAPWEDNCSTSIGVYLLRPGAAQATYLTNGCGPVTSPDGHQIAFKKLGQIYVIDTRGHHERQLTKVAVSTEDVVWSPDGKELTYGEFGGGELYRIPLDGHGPVQESTFSHNHPLFGPTWSPDGHHIAFTAGTAGTGPWEIDVIDVPTQRFRSLIHGSNPVWSPDGQWIAYSAQQTTTETISVIQWDGTHNRQLAVGASPTWSPDGQHIAFKRRENNVERLYVMATDGSKQRVVTTVGAGVIWQIVWSPDGRYFAVISAPAPDRSAHVFITRADAIDGSPAKLVDADVFGGLTWTGE